MKASEYVKHMEDLIAKYGDHEVEKWTASMGRHPAVGPVLAYKRLERKDLKKDLGRHNPPPMSGFWHISDPVDLKGDPVFRV